MGENILRVRCRQCGADNQLPAVHCKRCGAKLDFAQAEKQMLKAGQPGAGERLRALLRFGVVVGLAAVLALLIWPGQMSRTVGTEVDARRYRMKVALLTEALDRNLPVSQVIAEPEINAHLRELVHNQPQPAGRLAPGLEDVGARFVADRAEVFIAVRRGPLTFTGHYFAKPAGPGLQVTGAQVGHLPLPGLLGRLYARVTGSVFRQMRSESRILRHLAGVSVTDGSIELLTRAND